MRKTGICEFLGKQMGSTAEGGYHSSIIIIVWRLTYLSRLRK